MIGFEGFPLDFAQRYRDEGYWKGEVLGNLLHDWAQNEPERIAIVDKNRYWSYGELNERANRFASGLLNLGIKPGDRIVIQMPNVASFAYVVIGMFRLGVIPVFALPSHRNLEVNYLCEYSEAVAYLSLDTFQSFDFRILARDLCAAVNSVQHIIIDGAAQEFISLSDIDAEPLVFPSPEPESVAFFLLSGGTTGLPKLIPRTHDDYCYQLRACTKALKFDQDGVYLAALPVSHNAALGCPGLLGALYVGGKVVMLTTPSPDEAFPIIKKENVTLTTLMPPLVILWLEVAEMLKPTLPNFIIQVGSARFAPELARKVRSVLKCKLTQWFGMAEGLLTYTRLDDSDDIVDTTQGRPLSAADEIRVIDEHGNQVSLGEVGELITRGPYTLRGYYKAFEYNKNAFTEDGFLRTGDLVRITEQGNLVVEGRVKDVINRGGEKIVASEIEDLLIEHPKIREIAVVAMPDNVMGEKSCAFVVRNGDAPSVNEINQFLTLRGLANYKLLDRLEVIDAMPRTKVGKLNKVELRKKFDKVT